jgi:hypothetical protein
MNARSLSESNLRVIAGYTIESAALIGALCLTEFKAYASDGRTPLILLVSICFWVGGTQTVPSKGEQWSLGALALITLGLFFLGLSALATAICALHLVLSVGREVLESVQPSPSLEVAKKR